MREYRLNTFQKLMIALLAGILVASLAISLFLSGLIARQMASANQNASQTGPDRPHVFIQLSNIDSSFRETFLTGAKRAAEENGMDLEIADSAGAGGADNYASVLEAAIDARVDGIILQPAWRDSLTPTVMRAQEKGIPFITVEEDMPASNRSCYVGTNSFEFGTLAARLAGEATGYQAEMAVVYRGLNQENDTESSLKLGGLQDIASQNPGLKIVRIEQGTNAFFGAEDTIRDILTHNPGVTVLACMTARDTVAAAQTVLDLNRLRYVQIIGTDLTPEIQDLLDKRVLYGTIARNPDTIGYRSVEAMGRVLKGQPVPDFIDVGLETIRNTD